jgi:hypothetical protein
MTLSSCRALTWILCLNFSLCFPIPGFAGVDRVKVIVENDPQKPGKAKVYFPHLNAWLTADALGVIKLPAAYSDPEVITVAPSLREIYGPNFTRIFPARDGIISLRAIPVTAAILDKAEQLRRQNKTAEAATAYALTAKREQFVDPSAAVKTEKMAYEALAQKYRVPNGYVWDGDTIRASPQLVHAVNAKLGQTLVPADGRFTVDDFRQAAQMKSYSPIIAEPQEKFFAERR